MSYTTNLEKRLQFELDYRERIGTLRKLRDHPTSTSTLPPTIDFSSNDYLGLARDRHQATLVNRRYQTLTSASVATNDPILGATGSRLLSGNSIHHTRLEHKLSRMHQRESALLANSGYDANLMVLSSLPKRRNKDVVLMDELCHNSLIMGTRLGRLDTEVRIFSHNNVEALSILLRQCGGAGGGDGRSCVFVVVESVYSMDGDVAPLQQILETAQTFGAVVIVDEAHGLGVFGRTNARDLWSVDNSTDDTNFLHESGAAGGTGVLAALHLEHHPALLCSVHTFGKAAGCHGAVICGSRTLVNYLLNFAKPLVYSTALPLHSLVCIGCAYDTMTGSLGDEKRARVFRLVRLFRRLFQNSSVPPQPPPPPGEIQQHNAASNRLRSLLLPSPSPIQSVLIPGNQACITIATQLRNNYGFDVYPIRSPTVPKGLERIRIILHSHNTPQEVTSLVSMLHQHIVTLLATNDEHSVRFIPEAA
eukprot:CAMPEP_0194375244 /NCGR_PEP_ID=MMETSP0174-20130528/23710_1 /TAXON_ID=216777 /ORGANISM="Proboscia alata, Strain PI-D3" /LENGTH=476 /DNA_ID=CAMNT_0039155301 /DNA_START=58 /DNA_END=1484 /DNA_ORIENTATION=-